MSKFVLVEDKSQPAWIMMMMLMMMMMMMMMMIMMIIIIIIIILCMYYGCYVMSCYKFVFSNNNQQ